MALGISNSYFGCDRRFCAALNALAARARVLDSSIPITPFPRQFSINVQTAPAIDKIAAAVAKIDGKASFIFGDHYQMPNRVLVKALIDLEARLALLGH